MTRRKWIVLAVAVAVLTTVTVARAVFTQGACANNTLLCLLDDGISSLQAEYVKFFNGTASAPLYVAFAIPTGTPAAVTMTTPVNTPGTRINCEVSLTSKASNPICIGSAPACGAVAGTCATGRELQPGESYTYPAVNGVCSWLTGINCTAPYTQVNLVVTTTSEL